MPISTALFKRQIWSYYRTHGRKMPWRDKPTPYYVVVSEIMLQQTQVSRVIEKFHSFTNKFPDWDALAKASVKEVLKEWSGLGYNRRALFLKRIAEKVAGTTTLGAKIAQGSEYSFLRDTSYSIYPDKLLELPGIGPNTAGSILAFAFNQPVTFIETNIRSVYIHFFFPFVEKTEGDQRIVPTEARKARKKISDDQLLPLIEKTIDKNNPREWYWALMDYGSFLKSSLPNPSRRSSHHIKQKPFKGSNREMRSRILQTIMKSPGTYETLEKRLKEFKYAPADMLRNIDDMKREGFIVQKRDKKLVIA
jgi:A/G-specific adenine glycosylase